MALPSTIYKANIQLSDIDRGRYETLQTTVAQHPSETEERLERSVSWSITITEGVCYLAIGNETLETAIRVLA